MKRIRTIPDDIEPMQRIRIIISGVNEPQSLWQKVLGLKQRFWFWRFMRSGGEKIIQALMLRSAIEMLERLDEEKKRG